MQRRALYEMGKALIGKGLPLMGALKVPAAHSLIWDSDLDPGAGHPNSEDNRMIKEFVGRIADTVDRHVIPQPVAIFAGVG